MSTKRVIPKCDLNNFRFDKYCLKLIIMDDNMQLFEQNWSSMWELSVSKLKFPKLLIFGQIFFTKNFIFYFLAKLILLNPQIWTLNTKLKDPKTSWKGTFQTIFFQKWGKCKKCNFTDFDFNSALQLNCSNTYRVSIPYGIVAIDCQSKIK